MYHPKSWGLWLVAALTPALVTKNPIYLLIAIGAVSLNFVSLSKMSPTAYQWGVFLRIGLLLTLVSVVFNLLFVRAGSTQLFTLPLLRWELPVAGQRLALIQVGGPVTLESLVYGLANGLALMGVLIAFATFNAMVDHYQLLRSVPRFLYQSAIVASIAITFVPQMIVAQREIREAQALRGHRFRGIRDLGPLFLALLAEGLERSITLAESMDARGFGGQSTGYSADRAARWGLLLKGMIALALGILAGGAFALSYFSDKIIGITAMLSGGGILIVAWSGETCSAAAIDGTDGGGTIG
jgi:energy-coupling factor transport system permease protein